MTGKEKLNDLMTEFDEMGYCPTTLCNDPDAAARDWKVRICCAINQIEREVRKEAAREFAKEFLKITDKFADFTDVINYILARFGVEVEQ